MTIWIKQSTACTIMFGPFVDKTDGVTLKTDATTITDIDHASTGIFLSKNGGTAAIRHATVTASVADAYGMMKVTLDTTDTNTLGSLDVLFAKAATYLPVHKTFEVIAANVYDSLIGGGDVLDVSAIQFAGQTITAAAGVTIPASIASPTNITAASGVALAAGQKVDVDTIKTNPVVNGGTVTFPTNATLASTTNITAAAGIALAAGQKVDVDTIKTNPVVNAGTVTFPTGATLASTTNITAGTITTTTNVTNAVLVSSGTGAGQLDITSGVVKANLVQILGTALTETAGQIAAAFKKFFDKATPTGTINSLPDAVAGAAGGVAIVGSVMGKSPATLAAADVSGNLPVDVKAITAGVDFSATMKTSITTAATAATPTVTISSGTGAGQLSITSGVVASNMTQIDGQATSGNNATLNLKRLSIVNDTSDPTVGIYNSGFGGSGIITSASLGHAIAINSNGGAGIYTYGSTGGLRIETDVGSTALAITEGVAVYSTSGPAVSLEPTDGHGLNILGGGTGKSINAPQDIAVSDGNLTVANLQLISAGQITVKKNTALPDFAFVMTDTDGIPATGLTVAAERRIDSGTFAACANTPATELANGWYTINLDASDLNGTSIALRFSAVGASDTNFTIITQD